MSRLTAKEEALYKALYNWINDECDAYECNSYDIYEKCAMWDTGELLYRIMSRIRNAEEEQGKEG